LKTHNLAPGDFPDIQLFASKLNDVKFSDFANFSQRQIDELDIVLNTEIPKLMGVRNTITELLAYLLFPLPLTINLRLQLHLLGTPE
jgi:Domain of unknown function (DUF5600)